MWKSKLKSKSSVDAGGEIEIWFEIWVDDELKYPFVKAICKPDEVSQKMEAIMKDLQDAIEVTESIPDNLEVIL
jgi:hypothetical protein